MARSADLTVDLETTAETDKILASRDGGWMAILVDSRSVVESLVEALVDPGVLSGVQTG